MYGAYVSDKLAGVLSVSSQNTISCIFVKKEYHKQGIGTTLIDTVLTELKEKGA